MKRVAKITLFSLVGSAFFIMPAIASAAYYALPLYQYNSSEVCFQLATIAPIIALHDADFNFGYIEGRYGSFTGTPLILSFNNPSQPFICETNSFLYPAMFSGIGNSNPHGLYYILVYDTRTYPAGNVYYSEVNWDGTNVTAVAPFGGDTTTRVISTIPYNLEATSTPPEIAMTYYINSGDFSASTSTPIVVSAQWFDYDQVGVTGMATSSVSGSGGWTTYFAHDPITTQGWYGVNWTISSLDSGGSLQIATSTSFIVGTSTSYQLYQTQGQYPAFSATSTAATISSCNSKNGVVSELTCEIGNAITSSISYMFYPSPASLNQFTNLSTLLSAKAPIGYFYELTGDIKSFSSTSTTTVFDLQQYIPTVYKDDFFTPIRTALSFVFWIAAIVWLFIRVKNINISAP